MSSKRTLSPGWRGTPLASFLSSSASLAFMTITEANWRDTLVRSPAARKPSMSRAYVVSSISFRTLLPRSGLPPTAWPIIRHTMSSAVFLRLSFVCVAPFPSRTEIFPSFPLTSWASCPSSLNSPDSLDESIFNICPYSSVKLFVRIVFAAPRSFTAFSPVISPMRAALISSRSRRSRRLFRPCEPR